MRSLSLRGHQDCHPLAREESWSLLHLKSLIFLFAPLHHLPDLDEYECLPGLQSRNPLTQRPGLPGGPEAIEAKTVVKTQKGAEK